MSDQALRPPAPPSLQGRDADGQLARLLREACEAIDRLLSQDGRLVDPTSGYSRRYRGKLAILRALLSLSEPRLEPELDRLAPLGYAYRGVETELGLAPGGGAEVLEELADLSLLQRELAGAVQICPRCRHFQVHWRETCVGCGSIDIEIERLIHHFHCAYTGLEAEFQQGVDLYCPRCRRKLFQLGQDFEWPHDTYVCHACERIFEEPAMQGLCAVCAHPFAGRDAEQAKVWSYSPTPLTVRAVELNRLTGLDVSEIMFDAEVRLATHDFLALEIERECHRVLRHGGAFSGAVLAFAREGREHPVFREWSSEAIRQLGAMLSGSLRPLDLVARLSGSRLGLLMPETDETGCAAVEARLTRMLAEAKLTTRGGQELQPVWAGATWWDEQALKDPVLAFFGPGEGSP